MSEKKQMILVETEEPKTLDDGNLQESNSPLCLPASDAPDLRTEDNSRGPFNVYVDKIRSYFGRKPTSPPSPPDSDTPDLQESFNAKSVAPSEAKSEAKSLATEVTTEVTNEELVYIILPHPEQSSSEPSLNLNLPLTKMPLDLRSMQLSYSVWCAPLKFTML